MTQENLVQQELLANGILHLRLNRVDKRNALTFEMYEALVECLDSAAADDSIHVLLMSGGANNFCSGNDLHDFSARHLADDVYSRVSAYMQALSRASKPLLAAVEGYAVGIGATMLLHFDYVYAHPDTVFQFPFVDLGLCPEFGSTLLLSKYVGQRRAKDWLMSARPIQADEAERAGFINSVLANPYDAALAQGRLLASKPRNSLEMTKTLLNEVDRQVLRQAMDRESARFAAALKGDEFKAGASRFLNRTGVLN